MDQQPAGQVPDENQTMAATAKGSGARPIWMVVAQVTAVILAVLGALAIFQAMRWSREAVKISQVMPVSGDGTETAARGMLEAVSARVYTQAAFQKAATLFTISFVVVALALVVKRKEIWFFSMLGALAGLLYLNSAFMHAPVDGAVPQSAPAFGEQAPAATDGH